MRNIYKFEREDEIGYDEYDSFVIIADDEKDALEFIVLEGGEWYRNKPYDIYIVGVSENMRGIVLSSYNAG